MPAINFRKEFVDLVESGKKRQTIRPLGKRRFKAGDKLYLYFGQRTKSCRKLAEVKCVSVDHIRIYPDYRDVIINGQALNLLQIDDLALADGFEDRAHFFSFFRYYGDDFEGQVIKW